MILGWSSALLIRIALSVIMHILSGLLVDGAMSIGAEEFGVGESLDTPGLGQLLSTSSKKITSRHFTPLTCQKKLPQARPGPFSIQFLLRRVLVKAGRTTNHLGMLRKPGEYQCAIMIWGVTRHTD